MHIKFYFYIKYFYFFGILLLKKFINIWLELFGYFETYLRLAWYLNPLMFYKWRKIVCVCLGAGTDNLYGIRRSTLILQLLLFGFPCTLTYWTWQTETTMQTPFWRVRCCWLPTLWTESVCIYSWLPEFLPLEYIAFCSRLTTKGKTKNKTKKWGRSCCCCCC